VHSDLKSSYSGFFRETNWRPEFENPIITMFVMQGKIAATNGFPPSSGVEVLLDIATLDFGLDYLIAVPATTPMRSPEEIDDRHDDDAREHDEQNNRQKECDQ